MIRVDNIWKKFKETSVLQGLSIYIHTGETLVIIGRSGVGKSIFLKHLIGIEKPDAGTIEIDNTRVSELYGNKLYAAIRPMGMLFQEAALFDFMTVGENVAFHLKQHGDPISGRAYSTKEIEEKVEQALEIVGLAGSQMKMPYELSGGMKKRTGIARLLAYGPKYLLYDEPTAGLDPITAMQINDVIVRTKEEMSVTSIVVTHDMFSASYIADRLALAEDGIIACIDTPEKFLQSSHPTITSLKKMMRNTRYANDI
ncbi:MAG: ABC transporter ATP-binding protein [Chlamydiales bacterium]